MFRKLAVVGFAALVCMVAPASAQIRIGPDGVRIGDGFRGDRGYRGQRARGRGRGYDRGNRGRGRGDRNRGRVIIRR